MKSTAMMAAISPIKIPAIQPVKLRWSAQSGFLQALTLTLSHRYSNDRLAGEALPTSTCRTSTEGKLSGKLQTCPKGARSNPRYTMRHAVPDTIPYTAISKNCRPCRCRTSKANSDPARTHLAGFVGRLIYLSSYSSAIDMTSI